MNDLQPTASEPVPVNIGRHIMFAGVTFTIFCCLVVLASAAWVYTTPARKCLDRVSFRLFLWMMGAEIIRATLLIIFFGPMSEERTRIAKSPACGFGGWLFMSSRLFCNWICCCIGLNLCLTVVFQINPVRYRVERWYILGSLVLSLGVPVVPAILGHFGYDPYVQACYFAIVERGPRFRAMVLDLHAWQCLASIISTVCVGWSLVTIFRHGRATSQALSAGNILNRKLVRPSRFRRNSAPIPIPSPPDSPAQSKRRSILSLVPSIRTAEPTEMTVRPGGGVLLGDRFSSIALRVSLYPLALIFVNFWVVFGDVYLYALGFDKDGGFAMYIAFCVVFTSEGGLFALIGLLVDPCLRNGVKEAWKNRKRETDCESALTHEGATQIMSFQEMMGRPTLGKVDRTDTLEGKEMLMVIAETDEIVSLEEALAVVPSCGRGEVVLEDEAKVRL
ncbi:hypothetical protein M231_01674 [Tremella mesenterica]|uniref:G-protein coupled receptors family 1 profile domain-containing protein n=1 Tax=Tremella mesenterica TaxID=5217 RepID=A0A4Q1BSM9_TREME|nr:hypothetical protein M231_01674 [Tremella mesenterica]